MPGSYPKLERFSLWLRWVMALCLILGGGLFCAWMAVRSANGHAWSAFTFWAAVGATCVIGGILQIREPKLSLTGSIIFFAFSLGCLAYVLYPSRIGELRLTTADALVAGAWVLWAGATLYRHYRAPAKGNDAHLGYWWWIDRRLK